MKHLDKARKKELDEVRSKVRELEAAQEKLFKDYLKKYNIQDEYFEDEVFDYLHNSRDDDSDEADQEQIQRINDILSELEIEKHSSVDERKLKLEIAALNTKIGLTDAQQYGIEFNTKTMSQLTHYIGVNNDGELYEEAINSLLECVELVGLKELANEFRKFRDELFPEI